MGLFAISQQYRIFPLELLSYPLVLSGAFLFVYAFVVQLLGTFNWKLNKAWGPRWYTKMTPQELLDARTDGISSFSKRFTQPQVTHKPRWFGQPEASWAGRRVLDPDTHERPDEISARGSVDGVLQLGTGGVWFQPDGLSPEWQRKAHATIPWSKYLGVRVVPARAGIDGIPRRSPFYRSWWQRLVIRTTEGEQLYEIHRRKAKDAALVISDAHAQHITAENAGPTP